MSPIWHRYESDMTSIWLRYEFDMTLIWLWHEIDLNFHWLWPGIIQFVMFGAKVWNLFRPFLRLEKTRWACGKKWGSLSEPRLMLTMRKCPAHGLNHESFHIVSHLSQTLKILRCVEIMADFVERWSIVTSACNVKYLEESWRNHNSIYPSDLRKNS